VHRHRRRRRALRRASLPPGGLKPVIREGAMPSAVTVCGCDNHPVTSTASRGFATAR
jgi:hypothetical protein